MAQTKVTHTETPWTTSETRNLTGTWIAFIKAKGKCVAQTRGYGNETTQAEAEANARFIVTACNNHDKLVEALADIRNFTENDSFMNTEEKQIILAKCWLVLSQIDKDGE